MTKPLVKIVSMMFEVQEEDIVNHVDIENKARLAVNEVIETIRPLDSFYCHRVDIERVDAPYTLEKKTLFNVFFRGEPGPNPEIASCQMRHRQEPHARHEWAVRDNEYIYTFICEGYDDQDPEDWGTPAAEIITAPCKDWEDHISHEAHFWVRDTKQKTTYSCPGFSVKIPDHLKPGRRNVFPPHLINRVTNE